MPPLFSKILSEYVDTLDNWQRDVDNIRKMHHDIWKESRVYPIIKQHRAGSRVEKQCRILPMGKQTDVDYKFEVTGIMVDCNKTSELYWKPSLYSQIHGKVYASKSIKEDLQSKKHYSDIFAEHTFQWDDKEGAFLLLPRQFKEKVVLMSKFEYNRDTKITAESPSVPGQGAVNDYDIVPCLRLAQWPERAKTWVSSMQSDSAELDKKWRASMLQNEFLFVVPAGDPCSEEKELEFRLSFSLLEVKCFDKLSSWLRTMYGLIRYIYKTVIEEIDLLDSYHIKSIFFSMLNETDINVWSSCDRLALLSTFYHKVKEACLKQYVPHIFVRECNIFPFHKSCIIKKIEKMKSLPTDNQGLERELIALIIRDLKLEKYDASWLQKSQEKLKELQKGVEKIVYINGYMTRLLSLITFSLYENKEQNTLEQAIDRISKLFESNSEDRHIWRMIPMVNATLVRMDVSGKHYAVPLQRWPSISLDDEVFADKVSNELHWAFEAYTHQEFSRVDELLQEGIFRRLIPHSIGISVTSFHKTFYLDKPLEYIITTLESRSKEKKCPRFYLNTILLAKHLRIQIDFRLLNKPMWMGDLENLRAIAFQLSDRDPYLGRLSYKHAAMLLLQGYNEYFKTDSMSNNILHIIDTESFDQRQYATNFDLR